VGGGVTAPNPPNFADPVVLLHSPYRVSFAYAGRDGAWKDAWQNKQELPGVVRITVRQADSDKALSVSTAALIHVDFPVACIKQRGQGQGPGAGLNPAQAQAQAQALQVQAQAQAQAQAPQARGQAVPQGLQAQAPGPNCGNGAPGAGQDQAAAPTRPPG
jgi:hypothetical protein